MTGKQAGKFGEALRTKPMFPKVVAKGPLYPYDRAREHLLRTGWRGIAGWNRDAKGLTKKQKQESGLDLYAKGWKTLILGASRDGGFEIYYPTQLHKTDEVLAEIDRYGADPVDPGEPDPRD